MPDAPEVHDSAHDGHSARESAGAAGPAWRRAAATALVTAVDRLLVDATTGAGGGADRAAHVLDLGGGTGGEAVRLALGGHRVTVVDPSPDALAALGRRAAEAGVAGAVRAVQGDAESLGELVDDGTVDLVLCHGVLEVVDDPAEALAAVRRVLRPSGRLSLLVAQRDAAVLARVTHGQLRQAEHLVLDPDGRWGDEDPLRRRFDARRVRALLASTGFTVLAVEGVRVFGDLVPSGHVDRDPDQGELLARLERHVRGSGAFLDIAAQLHLDAAPA